MQILLHSSKTMRITSGDTAPLGVPKLIDEAKQLAKSYSKLSSAEFSKIMKISEKKANDVKSLYEQWSSDSKNQSPAIDSFIGDIYSGLQVQAWSKADREYAHSHILILSGLYGGLRACDGIMPYRLEMAYKIPGDMSLYEFWGNKIAKLLPSETSHIINLSAVEYTKTVLPYVDMPVITPKFLTISPKTGEPTFVTVHTKVSRGAFARWLIQERIENIDDLKKFDNLNYKYDATTSTPEQPVFICETFGGLGLSVRLT